LKKRVVVTGIGVVSPIGIGKDPFWQALISGQCGIGLVTRFDASSYPCKFAGEVNDFEATDYMDPRTARRLSRGTQFAMVSARKAIEDANLDLGKEDPYRVGLCYGTALGPMDVYEKFGATFYERGLKRVHPSFAGLMNHNAMIGALAEAFKIHGYNMAVSTGCSSGSMAFANAYHVVSSGLAEILVAGGTDTPIYPLTFGLYSDSRSMASLDGDPKRAMCPYDKRRAGYILGEAAGTLIIEELQHAKKRKAKIYAEILGFGLTNDACDSIFFSPEAADIIKAFQIALDYTSLRPEEVDYICGHAYSGVILDKKESEAIKKAFGDHAYHLAVSSFKAATGDSMAGGTAVQGAVACLALHEGILPPTINYEVPDPELDLDYVPQKARKKDIRIALANSFGLGGTNVVVVYKKI
jgi:3-oxoacyl-[acyl-carrier-protein] synthase II